MPAQVTPLHSPEANPDRRKSSVKLLAEDIADIADFIASTDSWGSALIAAFTIFFILAAFACGVLSHFAVTSQSFVSPSHVILFTVSEILGFLSFYVSLRALAVLVNSQKGNNDDENNNNNNKTYGPFNTRTKVVAFLIIMFLFRVGKIVSDLIQRQLSHSYECGYDAYHEMLYTTKTIEFQPILATISIIIFFVTNYYVWCKYLYAQGADQNNSVWMKRISYLCPTNLSFLFFYFGLISFAKMGILAILFFFAFMFINFYVDSEARRKKKGLPPVTNNAAYVCLATTTVWMIIAYIDIMKQVTLDSSGPAAAAMVVNMLGIIFTSLFESLTVKATSLGNHGPFMFPFYFGLDLVNASILLSVDNLSSELFAVIFMQEIMGLCRNCGVYDIMTWGFLKVTGISDTEFALKSVAYLEELAVIAAVDSVSECYAIMGMLSLFSGEASVAIVDPSREACSVFIPCGEDGTPSRTVLGFSLVCKFLNFR